ncbi:MAG TPA: response regulator [Terriglobales bacterium]|nr:response regulator [Terriglobales bacterium]
MAAKRTKTVLIADDEPKVAETLSIVLGNAGYDTVIARDGEEAVRLIREAAPDAVLLDVILPRLDGVEVAIQTCQASPRCKVLLFSGRPDAAELLAQAYARGYSFEILAKPTRPAELLEKMRELLGDGRGDSGT